MMKKQLLMLLTLMPLLAFAATENVDGIDWTYSVNDGKAEVDEPGIPSETIGSINIPSTLGGYPVTSIGDHAFDGCGGLTSVTIPEGVTSIGDYAFKFCCRMMSVTIPSSVTSIGEGAFWDCERLASVTIPSGVTCIGKEAFAVCWELTSVTISEGVTSIGDGAFEGCGRLLGVTIPSSVTSIGDHAFDGCYGLTSVTIPSSVTNIGIRAFYDCRELTSVTIPAGVASIGEGVFGCCYGLTSVTIPASVTNIGEQAFNGCYMLTSVIIPSGVASIGSYAFTGCTRLASVTVEAIHPPIMDDSVFAYYCDALSTMYVPNGAIAAYATAEGWKDYATKLVEMVPVTELSIVWDAEGIVYDGTEKTPGCVAKYGDAELAKDVNYTICYEANTNAGLAKAILEGLLPYVGSVTNEFTIAKRSVTLTSGSEQWTYDGNAHSNLTVTVSGDSFVAGEGVATNGFPMITDVGSKPNAFSYSFLPNTLAENYAVTCVTGMLTITAAPIGPGGGEEPGAGEVPEGGLSKFDATYVYDGKGHTINTQALYAVTLPLGTPSFSFALAENGPWQNDPFVYTNVGEYVMWYKISAPNYADYKHQAKVTILEPPRVENVTARPRYPWNGLVDIKFTLTGAEGTPSYVSFTAKDVAGGTNLTMKTLYKSNGTAANVEQEQLSPGTYNWVWDATADLTTRWVSYASCVPTSSAVLFKDTQLTAIEDFYAVPCGNAINDKSNRAKGRWIKTEGAGKSVQFAFSDDKYTKCVCVHFEQSGADVVGYAKWARYVSGLGHENEDFDANSATTQTIATSETASGYGLCKMEARVPQPNPSVVLDRVVVEGEVKTPVYYVKFNANGGSGTMANEEFEVGVAKALTANAFTKSGYAFFGWSTSASGVRNYTNKQVVLNLSETANAVVNLYALYTVSDLAKGINCDTVMWITDSTNPWYYNTAESRDGTASVKSSGAGGGVADSWIQTRIAGPATIDFYYAKKFANGSFSVKRDSTELFKDSGATSDAVSSWMHKSFSIPEGIHDIRFNYHHGGGGFASGGNGVRIDQFKVTYQ